MRTVIKILFKIIAIPFIPALFIMGMIMSFFAWLSGRLLAIVSFMLGIGGLAVMIDGNVTAGIGILIMAFVFSPFGISAFAEVIANMVHSINGSLITFIAG